MNPDTQLLNETWRLLLPFEPPDQYEVNLRLRQNDVQTLVYAVEEIAKRRIKQGGTMARGEALKLFSAICVSVSRQRSHVAAQRGKAA